MSNRDFPKSGRTKMLCVFVLPYERTSGIPKPLIEYNRKASDSKSSILFCDLFSTFIATYAFVLIFIATYTVEKVPLPIGFIG